MKEYLNFINRDWVSAVSGQTFQNLNPAATREVVAEYSSDSREVTFAKISAEQKAFLSWPVEI